MKTTSITLHLLCLAAFAEGFVPHGHHHHRASTFSRFKKNIQPTESQILQKQTHTSTQLHWGVLINVPEDFFTITGISIGFAYTILRSWNRVTVENVAWENRLEDARLTKLEDDEDGIVPNAYTELELRKMDAATSKSAYGPDATMERERKSSRRRRVATMNMDEEDEYDEDYDNYRNEERTFSMTDEQIAEFEDKYGVQYDPYYDEPYTEDELPEESESSFVVDKVYGDRRYENGDIFYQDENNENIWWRQGGRPRLKQVWEMFGKD